MTSVSDKLIVAHVARRLDAMPLDRAIEWTAESVGMDEDRVRQSWLDAGVNPVQERTLQFLERDHGKPVLFSPLPPHPVARRLELGPGNLLAEFPDGGAKRFVIYRDGRFSPL